jgi:hypothetical protein
MASRVSLIQSRSIYVGTSNSVAPSDGNLIVSGNVGINTTSPSYKLDVSGEGRFTSTLTVQTGLSVSGNGGGITNSANKINIDFASGNSRFYSLGTNASTKGGFEFHTNSSDGSLDVIALGIASTGAATFSSSVTASSLIKSGGTSSQYLMADGSVSTTNNVAPRYVQTINVSQTGYTTICTVTGGSLASAVNMSFQGTSNSVVVNVTAQILVNHSQDISITTTSGFYSQLNIRVISNNNETYSVEAQVISGVGASTDLNIEVFPLNSESVAFGGSPVTPGTTLVHTTRQGLYVSASEPMSISSGSDIYAAGNVGIGTTSPATKLHVAGNGAFTGISVTNPDTSGTFNRSSIDVASNQITMGLTAWGQGSVRAGTAWVQTVNNYPLVLGTNDAEVMRLLTNGNVGIGTTNPTYKLQVAGTSYFSAEQTIQYTDAISTINGSTGWGLFRIYGGSNSVELQMDASSTTTGAATIGTYSNSDLYIKTNNTNKVVVKANGNVGINSTNPGAKLEVISANLGGTAGDQTLQALFSASNGNGSYLEVKDVRTSTGADWTFAAKRIQMRIDSTYMGYVQFNGDGNNSGMSFGTGSTTTAPGNVSEQMRITAAGNVGINTTNPTERLDVAGNGKLQGNLFLTATDPVIEGSGSGAMRIRHTAGQSMYIRPDQAGPVVFFEGVSGQTVYLNTASPSVNSTQNSSSTLTFEARARNAGGTLNIRSTSLQNTVYDIPNNLSRFSITGQNILYLEGNVGIGITDPAKSLHVSGGTGNVDNLVLQSAYNASGEGVAMQFNRSGGVLSRIRGIEEGGWNGGLLFEVRNGAASNPGYDGATNIAMKIASDGNVGIGTTSPDGKLDVTGDIWLNGDNVNSSYYLRINKGATSDGGILLYRGKSTIDWQIVNNTSTGDLGFYSYGASSQVFYIQKSTGNVGIGTTSPAFKLDVGGTFHSGGDATFNGTNTYINSSYIYVGNNASDLVSISGNTMYFPGNGNVGIGTTSPLQKLHVSAGHIVIENTYALYVNGSDYNWGFGRNIVTDSGFLSGNTLQAKVFNGTTQGFQVVNSSNTALFEVEGNTGRGRIIGGFAVGSITPSTTAGRIDASNDVVAYSTSDKRLKENITPIANALDKVKSLTGVEFDWKEDTKGVHGYEGHDVGVIAQEVQAVLPEAIRTNDSGYLSVRYEKMIALLIEANKELASEVEQLKTRLDGLTK